MRLNSPAQLETAAGLFQRYGGWAEVRDDCVTLPDGTLATRAPVEAIERALDRLRG